MQAPSKPHDKTYFIEAAFPKLDANTYFIASTFH